MFHKRTIPFLLIGALAFSASLSASKTKHEQLDERNGLKPTKLTLVASKAMPATVFIKATITTSREEDMQSPFDFYGDDFFQKFFRGSPFFDRGPMQPQPQLTSGSGFFISADGYIVTNYHVIKDAKQISIVLNDGREFVATVTGSDPRTDLAVLKVEGENFPILTFGDSDRLEVGAKVAAVGNPFALQSSITSGIVSAKGRQDLGLAAFEDFIQTDAAINPGNSGGPLLDLQGNVIGVNTAIMTRTGGYMGIGLAIPSKMAKHVVDQIIHGGSVKRAYLGVLLQPVDKELAEAMSLEKQEGVLISDIVKGSAAEKAGLKQGDIVLAYNDQAIKNLATFRNDISMMAPGSEITLNILRSGKPLKIKATMGVLAENEVVSAEVLQKLGLEIENITPELSARLGYSSDVGGVVITRIKPGSIAAVAGLKPSLLITGIVVDWNNQKKIHNTEELEEALHSIGDKKHLILIVRAQNYQRYYTLKLN